MSVKYIPKGNAKIVIGKVTYQNEGEKNAVLPVEKIGKEELQRLVDRKLVVKIEFNEDGTSTDKAAEKEAKKHEALIAKAKELGIETKGLSDEQIREKIVEVQKAKK